MRAACLWAALLVVAAPASASAGVHHQRMGLGDWRLDIARDRFSGEVVCRLARRDHRAVYRAGAVGWRFAAGWDVGQAVYRVDGAAPRRARDDLPELIARQVPVDRGPMEQAQGGIVWVPYERLAEANRIAIATRPGHAPKLFLLRGLAALHDMAVARGCTPESRFIG